MHSLSRYKNYIRTIDEAVAVLEYRQDVTIRQYGAKILDQMKRDAYLRSDTFQSYSGADRYDGDLTPEVMMGYLFHMLETSVDPTPDHRYTPWLARAYASGIKYEDLARSTDFLSIYDQLKQRNVLDATERDIMKFSPIDLENIAMKYVSKWDAPSKAESVHKGNSETVLDTAEARVIHPLDMEAAKYYGQGTKWCTAADRHNMFDYYNDRGPLYIILPKKPGYVGEKYQIHMDTLSYMNEQDKEVQPAMLLDRFENDEELVGFLRSQVAQPFYYISENEFGIMQSAIRQFLFTKIKVRANIGRQIVGQLAPDEQVVFRHNSSSLSHAQIMGTHPPDKVYNISDPEMQYLALYYYTDALTELIEFLTSPKHYATYVERGAPQSYERFISDVVNTSMDISSTDKELSRIITYLRRHFIYPVLSSVMVTVFAGSGFKVTYQGKVIYD